MNYLDLFSGIGGFALSAYWAGMKFENHYASEIDPYCIELYQKRFPDSIQLGDITKIETDKLPKGDWIITGGFPCQDISIAGKGAGITGSRSGLWFEMWRLIRDLRPRFAIMENVGMLVHRGLREVLGGLAEIGYDAECQDIRASDMGAPHRRERLWIVGYPSECGLSGESRRRTREKFENRYMEMEARTIPHAQGQRCGKTRSNCERPEKRITSDSDVADTSIMRWREGNKITGGLQKRKREKKERSRFANNGNLWNTNRRNGNEGTQREIQEREKAESERNSGRDWWAIEPDVGRVAHGVQNRVDRLKGLGNAIVPQIAELLFRQIKDAIHQ